MWSALSTRAASRAGGGGRCKSADGPEPAGGRQVESAAGARSQSPAQTVAARRGAGALRGRPSEPHVRLKLYKVDLERPKRKTGGAICSMPKQRGGLRQPPQRRTDALSEVGNGGAVPPFCTNNWRRHEFSWLCPRATPLWASPYYRTSLNR